MVSRLYTIHHMKNLKKDDYEESPGHAEISRHLSKTLYYGGVIPCLDRPSLPLSELAVDYFCNAAPRKLGKADMDWISKVGRSASVSPCSMMLGMIYIERLKHKNPNYLQKISSSDLFLISMMMAAKFSYDEGIDEEVYNDEWAEASGLDVEDVNELEEEFLRAIDWQLFVKPDDFEKVLTQIEERIAISQGINRGFFTYTDLRVISGHRLLYDILCETLKDLLKVIAVCSTSYAAGILSLIASVLTYGTLTALLPPGLVIPLYPTVEYHSHLAVPVFSRQPLSANQMLSESANEILDESEFLSFQARNSFPNYSEAVESHPLDIPPANSLQVSNAEDIQSFRKQRHVLSESETQSDSPKATFNWAGLVTWTLLHDTLMRVTSYYVGSVSRSCLDESCKQDKDKGNDSSRLWINEEDDKLFPFCGRLLKGYLGVSCELCRQQQRLEESLPLVTYDAGSSKMNRRESSQKTVAYSTRQKIRQCRQNRQQHSHLRSTEPNQNMKNHERSLISSSLSSFPDTISFN